MKIVEFSQNLHELKHRCVASYNAGNFLLCLNYAFLAIENTADSELYLIIADCYYKMSVYERSLEWYSLSLINKKNLARSFIGLCRCFIELKKYEFAFLYLNKAIEADKKGKFTNDVQNLAMFLQSDKILSQINNKKKFFTEVNAKQLEKAKLCVLNAKYAEADKILSTISPNTNSYIEALNTKATLNIMQGDYITAYELANKVLQRNPKDVKALCNVSLSYCSRGNMIASMSVIKSAMAIKDLTIYDKLLIATTLCQLNAHKLVILYITDILKTYKYNFDFLILLSIAYNNSKQYELAIKNINKCLDIFRFDTICLSLKNKILQCQTTGESIPYINQIYVPEEISLLSNRLEQTMGKTQTEVHNYLGNIKNKEFVIWAINTLGSAFSSMLVFNIVRSKNFEFVKELLLSTRINANIKIALIKELILQNYIEKLPILFENVYSELNLKKIKEKMQTQDFNKVFLKAMGMNVIS